MLTDHGPVASLNQSLGSFVSQASVATRNDGNTLAVSFQCLGLGLINPKLAPLQGLGSYVVLQDQLRDVHDNLEETYKNEGGGGWRGVLGACSVP